MTCGSARRPDVQLRLSISNFARNSSTAHSNIEFASLELQRFWGVSKNDHDKLRATFGWRWCCCCPWVSRLGAAGEVARWFETAIAFARLCPCGCETAIAFAGEKWAFLAQFSGAEVMPVSAVPCWRRAVVSLVSMSPRCRVVCAKKFALRGSVIVHARKYSPCALKTPQNWCFWACWANFFAEEPLEGLCWASFFAPIGPALRSCRRRGARGWLRWGVLQH